MPLALRVLVIEADTPIRSARMDILRAAGFSAAGCEEVDGARAAVDLEPPDACIVADSVPGALELVRELRNDPRTAESVVLFVCTGAARAGQALRAGAHEIVLEPDLASLVLRLNLSLERRAFSEDPGGAGDSAGFARRDLAVLFADVRGFTAFTESYDPETVVLVLNELFESLVGDVFRYGGEVDKFIGDAVLALFGAHGPPHNEASHELAAVKAALDMMKSVHFFNRDNLLLADRPIGMGIGIASGEAVVGLVGSRLKRQHTAIGAPVNLASRLQTVAAEGEVVLSDLSYQRARDHIPACMVQDVAIKGRGVQRVYVLPATPTGQTLI